jgi:LacI family transcriptional regulator
MPATIKDIAARLGVSHSTVSRALGDFPYVSEDLRRRVRDVARELNYRPNALARGLKGMRTRVVGLVIPDLMNDFYASAATIIQATLAEDGYRLLLCVSGNDPRAETAYLRALREERVEGLIWVPRARHARVLREYAEEGVPIVELARKQAPALDGVVADDVGGSRSATEHLLGLGHTRIGLIVGPTELSTGRERLGGYTAALEAAGRPGDPRLIRIGTFDRVWGRRATEELMRLSPPPTALFVTSSELMVGALRALDERRVAVPGDVSLVGFGDPEWFAIWRPPITTVAFPVEDLAVSAVQTLLRRVRAKPAPAKHRPVTTRLSCHFVVRDSTGPPATRPRLHVVTTGER